MVSYAAPGGGVGPHFDSYDVFLLQGRGRAPLAGEPRSAISSSSPTRRSRSCERFVPEQEWTRRARRPAVPAAAAARTTASRSASASRIRSAFARPPRRSSAQRFLEFLQDRLELDRPLRRSRSRSRRARPGRIPPAMVERAARDARRAALVATRDVARVHRALTSPSRKPNVVFSAPRAAVTHARSSQRARAARGVRLALPTPHARLTARDVFMNGEAHRAPAAGRAALRDARRHARACSRALGSTRARGASLRLVSRGLY